MTQDSNTEQLKKRSARNRPTTVNGLAKTLGSDVNKFSLIGLSMAIGAIVVATLLATWVDFGHVTPAALLATQAKNPALWILDFVPLLFMFWGQIFGSSMALRAGAMVVDETSILREHSRSLELQLTKTDRKGLDTGLPGRSLLLANIEQCQTFGEQLSLSIFEIAEVRSYASVVDRATARDILIAASQRIEAALLDREQLFHTDDYEFCVISTSRSTADTALQLATSLLTTLDSPIVTSTQTLSLQTSIGIAISVSQHESSEDVLRKAETAMYAAIGIGRDALIYKPGMEHGHSEMPRLAAEFHEAIVKDELTIEYHIQPAINPADAAIVRMTPGWRHSESKWISEASLLSLSQRPGLTEDLLRHLVERAFSDAENWKGFGKTLLSFALPERALEHPNVCGIITAALAAFDFPANRLTLEINENDLKRDPDRALTQLRALRGSGINLALSHFGNLGTSVRALTKFPFNQASISEVFFRDSAHSQGANIALSSCMDLCNKLDIRVTICGVDNAALHDKALKLGGTWESGAHNGDFGDANVVSSLLATMAAE